MLAQAQVPCHPALTLTEVRELLCEVAARFRVRLALTRHQSFPTIYYCDEKSVWPDVTEAALRWRQSDEFCAALSELLRKMIAIPIAVGDATLGGAATSAPPAATPDTAVPNMLVRIFELVAHVLLAPHQVLHALVFAGEAIEVWGARAEAALCTMAGDHEAQDASPASRSVAAIGMLMGQVGMQSCARIYVSLGARCECTHSASWLAPRA